MLIKMCNQYGTIPNTTSFRHKQLVLLYMRVQLIDAGFTWPALMCSNCNKLLTARGTVLKNKNKNKKKRRRRKKRKN